jgi:hypothetical protein
MGKTSYFLSSVINSQTVATNVIDHDNCLGSKLGLTNCSPTLYLSLGRLISISIVVSQRQYAKDKINRE